MDGSAATPASVKIATARGVDERPLDVSKACARERLMAFAWTDAASRAERLRVAIDIAQASPPQVDQQTILDWLPLQLAEPQPERQLRAVFHSMVLQYLAAEERSAAAAVIAAAGERADEAHPLAWISFEWTNARDEVRLLSTCWPGGKVRHLATCHPYGDWICWHSDTLEGRSEE